MASTNSNFKLLQIILGQMPAQSLKWDDVAKELGINKKAAQVRWSRFKDKLKKGPVRPSDNESKLLISVFKQMQSTGIKWDEVAKEFGINKKAAQVRWSRFKDKHLSDTKKGGAKAAVGGKVIKKQMKNPKLKVKQSAVEDNGGDSDGQIDAEMMDDVDLGEAVGLESKDDLMELIQQDLVESENSGEDSGDAALSGGDKFADDYFETESQHKKTYWEQEMGGHKGYYEVVDFDEV